MARIAALDGWRAISIVLVLIGHVLNYRLGLSEPHITGFAWYASQLGVKVFFVISGYLITTISLKEEAHAGALHAGSFYLRRAFRILPAFAAYLLGVTLLSVIGAIDQSLEGLQRAAQFSCNIPGRECGWFANHTWSLAYEQQFYLLFPLVFLAAARTRRWWALGIHLVAVVAPCAALALSADAQDLCLFIGRFSSITMGVVLGLFGRELMRFASRRSLLALALAALLASVALAGLNLLHLPYPVRSALDGLLLPPAVAWLIFVSVHAAGAWSALLELRAVRYLGAISYSLYLWQQVFTGPAARYVNPAWFTPLLALPIAMLSYHFIEQPFVRWGRRLSARLPRRTVDPGEGARSAA